jgi:hypothetical protein
MTGKKLTPWIIRATLNALSFWILNAINPKTQAA